MTHTFLFAVSTMFTALALAPDVDSANHKTALAPQLGTPAQGEAHRTVKINASTKYVNAAHREILIIENHKGQSFAWQFDTLAAPTGFPLRRIAPPEFELGNTWVYIHHPVVASETD